MALRSTLGLVGISCLLSCLVACGKSGATSAGASKPDASSPAGYHVTIRETSYGIPHVLADDLPSAAAGLGYVGARDYGCVLEDQIVRIRSERGKFFGPGSGDVNLDSDFAMLTLGIHAGGATGLAGQSAEMKKSVDGYVAGFNHYLATNKLSADCDGKSWVRPLTSPDLFAYYYWLAQLASADPFMSYIGNASPPGTGAPAGPPVGTQSLPRFGPTALGSNGWSIGADKSETGHGLLLANPHFPWEGNRRFYESQITVPGVMNVYGASLLGVPIINIGFNENVAWTHTVTEARHFTLYKLTLSPTDPTSYLYDGKPRAMTSKTYTLDVLQPDGTTKPVSRTMYHSHYGPVVSIAPLGGWTAQTAYTIRNANENNFAIGEQWLEMDKAKSLTEFDKVNETVQGIPWVNTMAVDASGTSLYADGSRTPNLSAAALTAYESALATDTVTQLLDAQGATLLDGSDSTFEWVDAGAVAPGIVPYSAAPRLERQDYVFNSNNSYWLTNPAAPMTGFSVLYGKAPVQPSPRTRMNLLMLTEKTATGVTGADGKFSFDELSQVEFGDRQSLIEVLLDQVLARCHGAKTVTGTAGTSVDVSGACAVLTAWDRRFKLDSVGAVLWREFLDAFRDANRFSDTFDPTNPIATPKTLSPAPTTGADPVLVALADAVTVLARAGFDPTTKLGDTQHTLKGTTVIPIHGGLDQEGAFNVVNYNLDSGTLLPSLQQGPTLTASGLTKDGYLVNEGSSFMMVLEFTDQGPRAQAVLSYSQSTDPTSPHYSDQTELFSSSKYRPVLFTEDDIAKDPNLTTTKLDLQAVVGADQ